MKNNRLIDRISYVYENKLMVFLWVCEQYKKAGKYLYDCLLTTTMKLALIVVLEKQMESPIG